ncbi:RluA family pseudouridine synthase [Halothiobacillus sp. DCM-1]|uniref:RluA family pseudouridine synthase n=1 Tax=Halothiobacillus sp. DCM-1 TaxID=3112558 RepID=UPI0032545EBF
MTAPTDRAEVVSAPSEPWRVLDQTPDYLIIRKPDRLLSQPGVGPNKTDSLITRVQAEYPEALIVHRLDWDTSGLMVLARSKAAHRALSIEFQERRTEKRYRARVDRPIDPAEGWIDRPIGIDRAHRPRSKIDVERGRPAQTRYAVTAWDEQAAWLDLWPITGRSHQLRVHLLSIGHPIQGDTLYHPEAARHPRLMLHAEYLAFADPRSGDWRVYEDRAPF